MSGEVGGRREEGPLGFCLLTFSPHLLTFSSCSWHVLAPLGWFYSQPRCLQGPSAGIAHLHIPWGLQGLATFSLPSGLQEVALAPAPGSYSAVKACVDAIRR